VFTRDLIEANGDGNSEIFLGSSTAAGIPTLSARTQIAMAALLIVGGLLALRRTKRAVPPTRPA